MQYRSLVAAHLSAGDATTWAFIQRLTDLAQGVVDREVQASADLSGSDLDVLRVLAAAPSHTLLQSELAQELGWDKSRLSHQLTRMEHRGFVERSKSGRNHAVTVTRDGVHRHELALSAHAHAVRELLANHLSPQERAALQETAHAALDPESDEVGPEAASTPAPDESESRATPPRPLRIRTV